MTFAQFFVNVSDHVGYFALQQLFRLELLFLYLFDRFETLPLLLVKVGVEPRNEGE